MGGGGVTLTGGNGGQGEGLGGTPRSNQSAKRKLHVSQAPSWRCFVASRCSSSN